MTNAIRIPNASNGLPLVPQPWRHVTYFQSCWAEHKQTGYFAADSVPLSLMIDIMMGKSFVIVDGTSDGKPPRAFTMGVLAYALVWERAHIGRDLMAKLNYTTGGLPGVKDCIDVAMSNHHNSVVATIRKFAKRLQSFPTIEIVYQDGRFFKSTVADNRVTFTLEWKQIPYDDSPEFIKMLLCKNQNTT